MTYKLYTHSYKVKSTKVQLINQSYVVAYLYKIDHVSVLHNQVMSWSNAMSHWIQKISNDIGDKKYRA